jgi:hypothetical protein
VFVGGRGRGGEGAEDAAKMLLLESITWSLMDRRRCGIGAEAAAVAVGRGSAGVDLIAAVNCVTPNTLSES